MNRVFLISVHQDHILSQNDCKNNFSSTFWILKMQSSDSKSSYSINVSDYSDFVEKIDDILGLHNTKEWKNVKYLFFNRIKTNKKENMEFLSEVPYDLKRTNYQVAEICTEKIAGELLNIGKFGLSTLTVYCNQLTYCTDFKYNESELQCAIMPYLTPNWNVRKYDCCSRAIIVRFPSAVIRRILFEIMPAMYLCNVELYQSFINPHQVGQQVFPESLSLSIKYPQLYLDFNGNKNTDNKVLVDHGTIRCFINEGDMVVMDDNLSVRPGILGISLTVNIKQCYGVSNSYLLNCNKSTFSVDTRTGIIMFNICASKSNEEVHKFIEISIVDFFNNVVATEDGKTLMGCNVEDLYIRI